MREAQLDDLEPVRSTRPQPLDDMSIDELKARIAALEAEISACRAQIEKKQAQKAAADALFGPAG